MRIQHTVLKAAIGAVATAAAFSVLSSAPAAAVPLKADRGKLTVVADGVPQGRSAKITVAGKKYRKKLPKAGALRNLKPGTYRVWATPIVVDGGTAAVPNLPVRVKVPKRKSTTLRLTYQWNPKSDIYPPGPVTGLSVSGRTTSSISLRWLNSQAPDLQGVAIRRAVGTVAPASLDEGRVVDGADGQGIVDTGLRQYTTYSYSVFMLDTAGNASAPATITAHTTGRASQVTAGLNHSCALVPDDARGAGHVVCWGSNAHGQLGDGTTADSDTPREVALDDVVQISAGGDHTCALQSDGDVWCWGANGAGQLGNGSTDDSSIPMLVGLPASGSIAAGGEHTCAVAESGALRCWGAADSGQSGRVGDPVLSPRATVLTNVLSVAAGWAHTCAVVRGGVTISVKCFGDNSNGQLSGSGGSTATPVTVPGLAKPVASAVAGVQHTCVRFSDSTLSCWGGNQYGQVGDGSTSDRNSPVALPLVGVTALAAGAYHTCAALDNGTMRCWGRNNNGRLGDGTEVDHPQPTKVAVASGVSSIAAGGYHSCAVSGGDTYCWGANPFGQLGTGLPSGSSRPALVAGL